MNVSIIGLGLIGGSFAKTIKKRTGHRVLGFDKNESVLVSAFESGAIDDVCTNFSDTDITLVALHPDEIVDFLKSNAHGFKSGAFVVDMCGVKRYICDSLSGVFPEGVIFVGGHPMAGREFSGFENSTDTLFEGTNMILTPDENIDIDILGYLCRFFDELGFGNIEVSTPERHDELISYTSQLAHIISSAYVKNVIAKKSAGFTADNFDAITRGAIIDEEIWAELFMLNGDFLHRYIEEFISNLKDFNDAILKCDKKTLGKLLYEGRVVKEAVDAEFSEL